MPPRLRTDLVDVYVVRIDGPSRSAAFLQLHRCGGSLAGTWQPVMGHIEAGETALRAASRELAEETGLQIDPADLTALEQVYPFFLPETDEVVLSPRFWVVVPEGWEPVLNAEHDGARWVSAIDADRRFMWTGQMACCRDILDALSD